jgi:mono/diheme cytochrome c family protein
VSARYARLAAVCATAVVCVAGCEKTARNMYDQPRGKPLAPSALWADKRSAREPVEGSVLRSAGTSAATSSGRRGEVAPEPPVPPPLGVLPGVTAAGASAVANATDVGGAARQTADIVRRDTWTMPVLERGRERFDIFCAPCHSVAGDGDGMIARRGFPHPPSFHIDRLRDAPDAYIYSVITNGYGAMFPYANRVPADDRRAIIAYIRALQLSQHAGAADLQPQARAQLERVR